MLASLHLKGIDCIIGKIEVAPRKEAMLERIQKIISAAGVTSRRAAEQLISEGRVRLNGQVVTELGTKADASKDHIKVDGKLINPKQPQTYIMLNKPAGFVTTMSDPEGRPTVQDLLKGVKVRVYPVRRLDYNTEGMLIMTNDGDFAHLITHPKHELPKTYLAKVKGVLDDNAIDMLEKGVFLDDGKTAPAKIKKVRKEEANSWVEITIHEGRKRQVRRMFDRVGRSVIRLKRIKTGNLVLGDLTEGTFRHLTLPEVKSLMEMAQNPGKIMPAPEKKVSAPIVKVQVPKAMEARQYSSSARPRPAASRSRGPVMEDTSAGRRMNQRDKPVFSKPYSRRDTRPGRGTADSRGSASARSYTPGAGSRPGASYGTARTTAGRTTAPRPTSSRPTYGAGPRNSAEGRKPDQRPWSSTRNTGTVRGTPTEGRRPSSGPRPNRSTYTGSTGSASGRTMADTRGSRPAKTFAGNRPRPAFGKSSAASGRPPADRPAYGAGPRNTVAGKKPDNRPWSKTRSSSAGRGASAEGRRPDSGPSRSYAPGAENRPRPAFGAAKRPFVGRVAAGKLAASTGPRSSGAARKPDQRPWSSTRSSGPRPNKSTFTGSSGKGSGPKFPSRGPGRKK